MRNDFESNYLAHHGILGQKWGQKNGPPYPLDAGDHSSSEKKAGWKESLKKKYEQKKLAKNIKKSTRKAFSPDNAQYKIGETIRSRLTKDQKENLVSLKEKWEKDSEASTKEYSKIYNKEYDKRFKNKKPSEEELDELSSYVTDKTNGSKLSEQAYKSWDEYIKYSRDITDSLIGKYGNEKIGRTNHTNKVVINRILDDIQNEKAYKQVFSDWNNAESKWYWNREGKTRTKQLDKKQKELGEKEAAFEEKLRSKGYTDNELRKMREEALSENPSYHKYEELSGKIRNSQEKIADIKAQIKETGWKPSGNNTVTYHGKSKNGGEIDLAYDHYINLKEDLDQTTEELKKLKKEYNK